MNFVRRECVIYRCNSSSTNDSNIRFFRFPTRDTIDYNTWMSTCRDSCEKIRSLENPFVCSLHFAAEEIGQQRLHPNSFPRFNLTKEYYAAQDEIDKKVDYLSNITREWIVRSQCYHNISRKTVGEVTRCVREILNIPRYIPNPLWIREFKYQPILPYAKGRMHTARPLKKSEVIEVINAIANTNQKAEVEQQLPGGGVLMQPVKNEAELDVDKGYEMPSGAMKIEDVADVGDEGGGVLIVPVKNEAKLDVDEEYDMPSGAVKIENIADVEDDSESANEKTIDTYEDALEYLKPLQYYVKEGSEHFAAIGLLAQLQAIFSDPEQS